MRDVLIYFAIKYNGDWDEIYSAILRKEKVDFNNIKNEINLLDNKVICILDEKYPSFFKTMNKPPFVLFYKGDISLLLSNNKKIGVIGSREFSKYGENSCKRLIDGFSKDVIVVSGLARGIDTIAHKESIKNNIKTIAVLGNGLDMYYPKENESFQKELYKDNLVISEYPPFTKSSKDHFPVRNRIIAAISDKVVVVESKKRSGTMITVNYALEMGKDIYCFPQRSDVDSGCNYLISQGAKLVVESKDVLDD